jgi:hypothetical protein
MFSVSPLVAQTSTADKGSRLFAEVLPWLLVLLGVIIVGGVIIFLARRYMQSGGASQAVGFTLHDLRQMHGAGEINDEEFERAKSQMIGRLKSASNADAAAGASPGNQEESTQ